MPKKLPEDVLKQLQGKFDAAFRKAAEKRRKEEEERYKPRTTRKIVGECSCGGEVVRVTRTEYELAVSIYEMRIGGSNPMRAVVSTETYCKSCKLMYSNSGKIHPKKKAARS
ncbi:MAG TPA: hypothetical protein VFX17_02405 [Patescibacteria group bacterium]|nr:hypothetical protein [Patescibacteria group bacterium]